MSDVKIKGTESSYINKKGERDDTNMHYYILDNPDAEREIAKEYPDRLRARGYSEEFIKHQIEVIKANEAGEAHRAKSKKGK